MSILYEHPSNSPSKFLGHAAAKGQDEASHLPMILWRCIYLNNSKDCWRSLAVLIACASLLQPLPMLADPIAVRHTEGLIHGFLVLRTPAGGTLARGYLFQGAHGGPVTHPVMFPFKDGPPQHAQGL